jgi:hypothetical protein
MTAVVEAESPTKRFGEVPAVTDLSFALERGKEKVDGHTVPTISSIADLSNA